MSSEQQRLVSIRLRDRLLPPVVVVALIIMVGTSGYYWLGREQGATFLDALYMTVITITTVGYGEVIRLNEVGRVFTIFVSITGIGAMFYSMTVIMDYLVMIRLTDPLGTKKMQREVDQLNDHIVIAGLGRVGRQAALELGDSGIRFVIIDPQVEAQAYAAQHGYWMILGDASDDSVLELAGIRRAKGLIVTSGDDASNLYIVLSARVLNPGLFIVSRAVDETSVPKLMRAGANRAISPYAIGGRRLAHLILSPTVVDFFDTVISGGDERLNLEGIQVYENSLVVGKSLAGLSLRENTGANILAILRGREVVPNPEAEEVLSAGDQILALGTAQQLESLEALLARPE
jgi:voltage-gated potassium channel